MVHPNYPNFSFDKSAIDTLANKLEQNHEILKYTRPVETIF